MKNTTLAIRFVPSLSSVPLRFALAMCPGIILAVASACGADGQWPDALSEAELQAEEEAMTSEASQALSGGDSYWMPSRGASTGTVALALGDSFVGYQGNLSLAQLTLTATHFDRSETYGPFGSAAGTLSSPMTCPAGASVIGLDVTYDGTRVYTVAMICANAPRTTVTPMKKIGSTGLASPMEVRDQCKAGYRVGGFKFRYGTNIKSIAALCVSNSGTIGF